MSGTKVWDLPDWKRAPVFYQLRDRQPLEDRWGWLWVEGHSVAQDPEIGYDRYGGLLVRALAVMGRHAGNRENRPLAHDPALAMWVSDDPYTENRVALWVPPSKHDALRVIEFNDGYLPVSTLLAEPPAHTIIPERG